MIGYHEHLLRRDGRQESFLFRENQVMDVVRQKTATIKRNYDYQVYKFNAKYFKCYDSAQTHTIKYQMPALVKRALMMWPASPLWSLMCLGPRRLFSIVLLSLTRTSTA
ncbi:hypothetical protein KCU57_09795 [Xanthomonas translucens]|uniref:hypothetical protein n=1 Tax=Xanthomonas campestris pv. translucens TaxID=343 RepID=UPI001F15B622|nr:hypothetical protein [Xanthomonas translucens]UKE52508.1 hypothetical protein KCU57_09795 [Xanthomonas translucens]